LVHSYNYLKVTKNYDFLANPGQFPLDILFPKALSLTDLSTDQIKDFSYAPVLLSGDVHLVPKTYLLLQFVSKIEHTSKIIMFFMTKDLTMFFVSRGAEICFFYASKIILCISLLPTKGVAE